MFPGLCRLFAPRPKIISSSLGIMVVTASFGVGEDVILVGLGVNEVGISVGFWPSIIEGNGVGVLVGPRVTT